MAISVLRESSAIANGNKNTEASAAIGIATYVIVVLIFCGFYSVMAIISLISLYKKLDHVNRKKKITFKSITFSIQIVAAIFYLYGDNIFHLVRNARVLNCDETCVSDNETFAFLCLGVALIIFHIAPPMFEKCYKLIINEENVEVKSPWVLAVSMIAVIARIDMLYSVVFEKAHLHSIDMLYSEKAHLQQDSCLVADVVSSWIFVVISVTFGSVAITVHCVHALRADRGKSPYLKPLAIFSLVTILLSFPLYILADNTQPLNHVFKCTNVTDEDNTKYIENVVRLGCNTLTLIVIASITIIFSCFSYRAKKSKAAQAIEM